MPRRTSKSGSELFIVDNSDKEWKVLKYLHDWCQISKATRHILKAYENGRMRDGCINGRGQRAAPVGSLMVRARDLCPVRGGYHGEAVCGVSLD